MAKATKNALISVYDKTGIGEFAKGLADDGWRIYASGGTAKAIKDAGVEVTDIADLVGGKAILGHRVVTLSREIHAGILADHSPEHTKELARLGIPRIDLVCNDMYPLGEAIATPGGSEVSVVEMTDIGGPTLLRAAAKGRRIVLSRAEQRPKVLAWLRARRPDEAAFLRELAATAEREVAAYVLTSAMYLGGEGVTGFVSERVSVPKYGENAWQQAAGLFARRDVHDPLGLGHFELRSGTDLSYNNYADIDRLLQTATHIAAAFHKNTHKVPAIALGAKHGNMCGAAVAPSHEAAVKKMLDGDPRAIFGGLVLVSGPITKKIADVLISYKMGRGKRLLDAVIASDVSAEALPTLKRKGGKLRVVTNPALAKLGPKSLDHAPRFRYVRGGLLQQANYTFVLDLKSKDLEYHGKTLTTTQLHDLLLGWAVGSTSNSNTITLVKNSMLIGNGVGQQDRVSAAELAVKRAKDAGHVVKGAVAYSDSFFPFPDGPLVLAKAGVAVIFASRGSVNDDIVAKAVTKAGASFYTMPDAVARGFFGH